MGIRITVDQLERMKTHELADLLANVVLLLRRMPDVEWQQLTQMPNHDYIPEQNIPAQRSSVENWTAEALKKKKVTELIQIASDLHIPSVSKLKKDDLVSKILARQAHGHSEQFAIGNL